VSDPARGGMGTAMVAALIEKNFIYIVQVGLYLSCYIFRSGRVKRISMESTILPVIMRVPAEKLRDQTVRSLENIVFPALGIYEYTRNTITQLEFNAGDYLLLCSDCFLGYVSPAEMEYCIKNSSTLEESGLKLMERAKAASNPENITLIMAKFEGTGLKPVVNSLRFTKELKVLERYDPEQDNKTKI
jgi:PPM family protein phosphatase